jgi:hypothetical protein
MLCVDVCRHVLNVQRHQVEGLGALEHAHHILEFRA